MKYEHKKFTCLRYSTAIAVFLVALSATNQAQAQCAPTANGTAGNDVLTCSGTITDFQINLGAGDDTITNDGTIQILTGVSQQAITSSSGSDTIINNGDILFSQPGGFGQTGISITGGATLGGGILNAAGATIDTPSSGGNSTAIDFVGSSTSGDIINNGTITSNGSGIAVLGSMSTHTGLFQNNGLIEVNGSGPGVGITGANLSGGFENTEAGDVRNIGSGFAFSFIEGGDISGGLTNAGLIESANDTAIQIGSASDDNAFTGAITNSGTIRGDIGIQLGAVGSFPSTIGAGSIAGGINNSGTIEGTGGTAIFYLAPLGSSPINIDGGRIVGDVVDASVAAGFSPVTITGSGFDTEGDFTVSSLSVNSGEEFRISTGDTFNTRTMSTAGTINFEVDAAGDVGLLNVTAGAIDLTGGAIGAEVDPGAALVDGQEILIGTGTADVIGTTGVTGQTLLAAANDSLLFDFSIADGGQAEIMGSSDANNLFFLVSQAASAGGSAVTSNANSAGETINTLMGATDPQFSAILGNVAAASTSEELEEVLQAVLPQVDTGSLGASQNVVNNTIRLVSDRLTTIRSDGGNTRSGISSGDSAESLQLWTQAFGQTADQGERKGIAGYNSDTYGITFGADTEGLSDKATVGIAVAYANTDVDSDNATNTQSDINSYNITLYGDYDLGNDSYLVGDIGYTYGDNESTRFNVGGVSGLNANSDYGSHQVQARAILAKDYYSPQYEGLRVTPKGQVRYTYFQNEDIEETGAGGANLTVDSDALNILEVGVGVDVRKDYVQKDGGILSPEVSVGYRYDLIGDAVQTTSTFETGGPSFRSEGSDPDQDTFNLGAGVGYTASSNMELTVSYDYESKDEFNSHSAFIRLAAPF